MTIKMYKKRINVWLFRPLRARTVLIPASQNPAAPPPHDGLILYTYPMDTWKKDRIQSILDGTNPTFLAEMESGYAVIADTQFLPGYSVLLPKRCVGQLNDLPVEERTAFLRDMTILGDAVAQACAPIVRLNYDILGNTDTYLHAHVFPRYSWEEPGRLKMPVWFYPAECWTSDEYNFTQKKYELVRKTITENLHNIIRDIKNIKNRTA